MIIFGVSVLAAICLPATTLVGKAFSATVTDIYYPCYHCITVASYRL